MGMQFFLIKRINDIAALKAISQNLMHSNISISDGVYGNLSENDVKNQIKALGQKISIGDVNELEQIKGMTKKILEKVGAS